VTHQVPAAKLRELPLFAGLADDVIARIAEIVTEIECPAGTVLAVANDPGAGMFVIEEGSVVVEARSRTIELGAGEFFGELSLLVPESTRVARVRALTPVSCLALSRIEFEQLLEEEPRIALAMLPVVARRLWNVMHAD
jgi:voltage-gated potassium channel